MPCSCKAKTRRAARPNLAPLPEKPSWERWGVSRQRYRPFHHPAGRLRERLPESGQHHFQKAFPQEVTRAAGEKAEIGRERVVVQGASLDLCQPGSVPGGVRWDEAGARKQRASGTSLKAEAGRAEALEWLGARTGNRGVLVAVALRFKGPRTLTCTSCCSPGTRSCRTGTRPCCTARRTGC